jgi:hypothetical protein
MTGIAIVASTRDAQFAQAVRAGLRSAGHAAVLSENLPKDPVSHVVLVWSAALEAGHAIDAQALIGLWSEGRLLVVRRDAAPLPLGLRDLPSLAPESSAADVCAALAAPAAPARFPATIVVAIALAVVLVGGGAYYYFTKSEREKQAALVSALESAARSAEDLRRAQAAQLESLKSLEQARAAEEAARTAGDAARLKEAQEAAKVAEAQAQKQADLVSQLESVASKARDGAKNATDAAKQMAVVKSAPVPAAAPAPVAAKAEAPKAEAVPVPKATTRSERERTADEEAARKALTAASAPPTAVASASPGSSAPASTAATGADHEALYEQAKAMESEGNVTGAVRIYRRAARAGSGKAAKRLGEIFDRGAPGVSRDYAESLQWYETARQLGVEIPVARRGGSPAPVAKAREVPEPKAAKAPPAPVPEAPKAAAPPPVQVPAPVPPSPAPEADSSLSYWVIAAIALLALMVFAWRRSRRAPPAEMPQPQAARAAAPPAADATMLFVSYSHKDRPRVEPIVSAIEGMGRRVWMDRTDITGQTGWAGQIVRAIRECRAVVLMASPNSYGSDQVVRELYLAMNHKKTIVPIEIEPADMPDELQYILAPFQHHRLSGGETRDVLGRALAAV